ncbi:peptidoglycan DD-metalloendopeptidase family protein [Phototrophicus methaneseepsis]|uniref:Peptidoglycan DD-metalloendopeptidase family protein n=1 Tax=Phototrophicus methaneseepsis TaxID=2710758 RepID=A0A7S8IFR0_9CHLR|nr:peptidoglycan DD-metalloendopeptidase family protein [Phototrophicus methaneseepsis]QPC83866.1 peptidoglycan DD-metalloendopeptidase family protein [Phototrophicus methaneseepsis]
MKRLGIIRGIIRLSFVAVMILALVGSLAQDTVLAQDEVPAIVLELRAALQQQGIITTEEASFTNVANRDGWIAGDVIIYTVNSEGYPTARFFVKAPDGRVAFNYTTEFDNLVREAPVGLVSEELITLWDVSSSLSPQLVSDNSIAFGLPFGVREEWVMTQGPHGANTPNSALDLAAGAGGSGWVRAPADGVVREICAGGQGWVVITHKRNFETYYYHLENVQVHVNQTVSRGTIIGHQGVSKACSATPTGAHVHFLVYYQGQPVRANELYFGGWRATSSDYRACLQRIQDGKLACGYGLLYNSGALGSGTTSRTDWNFNSADVPLGWVNTSSLSNPQRESKTKTLWTSVIGSDPSLWSPKITSVNTSDYGAIAITMASRVENCGQLFWDTGQGFKEAYSIKFDVDTDGDAHTYTLQLSNHSNWTGQLRQLRLDPSCRQSTQTGALRIDRIRLIQAVDPTPTPETCSSLPDTPGIYRASDFSWYLRSSNTTGPANQVFKYGAPSDQSIIGDWNGDGVDTVGIFRNGTFYLRNSNTTGYADITFAFGGSSDIAVAGDWDGDGIDTVGLYRPSTATWLFRNDNTPGAPQVAFIYGLANETPITGDWDGDGVDTIGIYRASDRKWYLRNQNSTGPAHMTFVYGNPAVDIPIVGDWNGDCVDTIGIYRASEARWYLRNINTTGNANIVFTYGAANEAPVAGKWGNLNLMSGLSEPIIIPPALPTWTLTPTMIPTESPTPYLTLTLTPTTSPTATGTPTLESTATVTASPTTASGSETPTATPTASATVPPTSTEMPIEPTLTPTSTPDPVITTAVSIPSATSTSSPTAQPTATPTSISQSPTAEPVVDLIPVVTATTEP